MNIQDPIKSISNNTNYLNTNYQYLKNVRIEEWDIHSAGLSVLKFKKALPEEELKRLESLPKQKRTVAEGLIQREHPEIAKLIIETLKKAVEYFLKVNQIQPENIISIKKDAVFVLNSNIKITNIVDNFEFRKKSQYSSVLILPNKKEFYYNEEKLETKGISKEVIPLQENYILKDIKSFMRSGERVEPDILFKILKSYRSKYLNKELPIETYRELNTGCFRFKNYLIQSINNKLINEIDISQNYLNYIFPIIQSLL